MAQKTGFVDLIGLNCCTISRNYTPHFFLFSDIDDKDPIVLRNVIKYYIMNDLSCYFYDTPKGYHVISPTLLNIEQWHKIQKPLKKILKNYYEFLNIRWTSKTILDSNLRFLDFGESRSKLLESESLHKSIIRRFNYPSNVYWNEKKSIPTRLIFGKYREFVLDDRY